MILDSQLGLAASCLGLLCPCTRAAPDFVIAMITAIRNTKDSFQPYWSSFHSYSTNISASNSSQSQLTLPPSSYNDHSNTPPSTDSIDRMRTIHTTTRLANTHSILSLN